MQITATAPVAPLATLSYTLRAPHGDSRDTVIEAHLPTTNAAVRIEGTFENAVRAAQSLAADGVEDGIHHLRVNQAQAVLRAGSGAWLVGPLVGEHRGTTGPIFFDGPFFRRAGLTVWASRMPAGSDLAAIVGVDMLLDFRAHRADATAMPIERALETPTRGVALLAA